jgi:site-specific DNA recombinase
MIDDGVRRKPKPKCGTGKQVPRDREEWIPVEVPAIIDAETFAKAQERLEYNKRALSGRSQHQYLMKARFTCTKCGYAMRGHVIRNKFKYYDCNGKRQIESRCDVPSVDGRLVDALVWEWIKQIIQNPEHLRVGLEEAQAELQLENQALHARMTIIQNQITTYQEQLSKLLDLYLAGDFPKEMLTERKTRLEHMLESLRKEQVDLSSHIRKESLSDEQINYIQEFCAKIGRGLEIADFVTKRKIIELLDVRGKFAIENDEKVLYLRCLIEQQPVSLQQISPLLNIGATATKLYASPQTALFP